MRALNRKLLRDLLEMRGMVLAIALVQVGGVATFVMSLSTYDTLLVARDGYYREQRFAEVFALLKRAPDSVIGRSAGHTRRGAGADPGGRGRTPDGAGFRRPGHRYAGVDPRGQATGSQCAAPAPRPPGRGGP